MFLLEERDGENKQIIPPEYYDKTRFETQFKAGAYYALNQFQQIEQENMSIPLSISSLGLDFVVEKHRWILKTGFEYLGWKEYGDYRIDYRQNQMVYQYNYVDSAFINTFSGQVTYFTSDRQVFDSVSGQRSEQASYRYRILQIPLLAGYRIIERGNFNISIIAGLGIDIRISGKQFTPVFSEEDASITEVSNSLQYRAINNWRVIGGLGLAYSLDKRWEIYVEPSYQQYMKPLYAPENTKGMGLFKVKAGIHFTF